MTRHRDQYAVPLEEWAALHAEELATDDPGLEQCGRDGHRPHPWHDECDDCTADAYWADQHARRQRGRDRTDIADAEYTHLYTLED